MTSLGTPQKETPPAVQSAANWALGLSIAGLVICCFPLGIAGIVLGFRAISLARQADVAPPMRARVSIVLGALSLAILAWAIKQGIDQDRARNQLVIDATRRLAGKRTQPALEAGVACDLVTEYLIDISQQQIDGVSCNGRLEAHLTTATLEGIEITDGADKRQATACLARGARWFVLGLEGECPSEVPPSTVTGDETALRAEEERLRAAVLERGHSQVANELVLRLTEARRLIASRTHAETSCPELPPGKLEIGYVDYQLLDAPAQGETDPWEVLTKPVVRQALDPKTPVAERAQKAKEVPAPFLAVFHAETRRWPRLVKQDASETFLPGAFDGWLSLVNTDSREVVCETHFFFESGDDISTVRSRLSSKQGSLEEALRDDFEDRFDNAAAETMNRLSRQRLRLGVKLLE